MSRRLSVSEFCSTPWWFKLHSDCLCLWATNTTQSLFSHPSCRRCWHQPRVPLWTALGDVRGSTWARDAPRSSKGLGWCREWGLSKGPVQENAGTWAGMGPIQGWGRAAGQLSWVGLLGQGHKHSRAPASTESVREPNTETPVSSELRLEVLWQDLHSHPPGAGSARSVGS